MRGDFTADSDVDLLIVVLDSALPPRLSSVAAYTIKFDSRIPMDVFIYRASRFNDLTNAVSLIPAAATDEGHVLYAA